LRNKLALYLDLIRWNRPAGWLLLLWPSLGALWIAAGGFPGWHLLVVFVLGTILMRSAGCCVNDVADREFDKHVKRTAQRPVTSGRVSPREALVVGAVLALAAFGLVLTTNALTVQMSFAALAITLIYPYAKRFVSMPQAVLGVAFSFGVPMAFAAVQAQVPALAWVLLVGNLFWVLAYDTEYAMVDRDDDIRIGMRTSAITLGRADVPAVTAFYLLYLAIWTAALWTRGCGAPCCWRRWPRWSGTSSSSRTGRARAASRPSGSITGWASPCSRAWCWGWFECAAFRSWCLAGPRSMGFGAVRWRESARSGWWGTSEADVQCSSSPARLGRRSQP
jgi:4-hydroxybenzoate polyprenyltransferase